MKGFKQISRALLIVMTFATFGGCNSEFESSIKQSEYTPYNRTIEEIFEKTSYCSAVEWDELEYKKTKLLRGACRIKEDERLYPDIIYLIYHFQKVNDSVEIYSAYYGDKDKKVWGGGNKGKVTKREAHQFLRYLFIDNIR